MAIRRSVFFAIGLLFAGIIACASLWSESPGRTDLTAIRLALASVAIPQSELASIRTRLDMNPGRFSSLLKSMLIERKADPMLLFLVDKSRALPQGYIPPDLKSLAGTGLSVARTGLSLRTAALQALVSMEAAARAEGIALLVSSTYRSYAYQSGVWDRGVAADGEAETAASIARPGYSQHQLGTALDFGSITDAFAETKASRWLESNATRFGFSLSFPKGMSAVTGYKWESWHYRYIGKAAATLAAEYFGGVQQYLLMFLEKL
jgi:D-alanyl-D-alanine carboxypeptidase